MERSYHLPNNVNCGAASENFQKKSFCHAKTFMVFTYRPINLKCTKGPIKCHSNQLSKKSEHEHM